MFTQLFRDWWLSAARGVLAMVFGILALFWPEPTKLDLVMLLGVFSIVDGFFAIAGCPMYPQVSGTKCAQSMLLHLIVGCTTYRYRRGIRDTC